MRPSSMPIATSNGQPRETGGLQHENAGTRELILNLHGLGEPHSLVDENEKAFWWSIGAFSYLLDRILDTRIDPRLRISITFDDGNASDALIALPELTKRGLTASFFICAGRIGKKRYLDESMIKDLNAGGMVVGSHGMDHQ